MDCVCCGGTAVGALCKECGAQVAPCEGLIPDHVRSTVHPADADAWLVDGFGGVHGLAEKSVIGRKQDGQIVVLAASVSRDHAELKKTDKGWQIRDLGSHNGTFVDKVRLQGRVILPGRAVVKFGEVALWFTVELHEEPAPPMSMATRNANNGVVRFLFAHNTIELCIFGNNDQTSGGSLLSRPEGTEDWKQNELAPLEFQLLRTLCNAAHSEANAPAMTRGCVPTKQLAKELPFRAQYADEENVRQVVRRLRAQLSELGADGVLAVVPGRGYYLACPVTLGQR